MKIIDQLDTNTNEYQQKKTEWQQPVLNYFDIQTTLEGNGSCCDTEENKNPTDNLNAG